LREPEKNILRRLTARVEFGEQPGLHRRTGVGVEAHPDTLHHRAAELAGGGHDLGGCLGTDTGYLLEPGHPGSGGLPDGAVAGGLDGSEPEPAATAEMPSLRARAWVTRARGGGPS
jgi:hypothetical protein